MISPFQPGSHKPNSLAGNNLTIPARDSLVSDFPAWDGKTDNLFLQCTVLSVTSSVTCLFMALTSVDPSCTACHCIFFFKMLSLSIYRYIFASVGQYCLPLTVFQPLSFLHTRVFSPCLLFLSFSAYVFLCLSFFFLSLSSGVACP